MNNPVPPLESIPVHEGIEEWMAVAVAGGLSGDEERLFAEHLAGCARCRELFAEENTMSQTLQNTFDTVRPLPGFERRLAATFRSRRGSLPGERLRALGRSLRTHPFWRVTAAGLAALALVALGSKLTHETPWPQAPGVTALENIDVARSEVGSPTNAKVASQPEPFGLAAAGSGSKDVRSGDRPQDGALGGVPSGPGHAYAPQPATFYSAARRASNGIPSSSFAKKDLGLAGANTYSGATTVTGGLLDIGTDRKLRALDQSTAGEQRNPAAHALESADATSDKSDFAFSAQSQPPAPVTAPTAATSPATPASPVPPPPPSGAPAGPAAPPDTRKLIRNASVALEVAAFDPAVDALTAAAAQTGGGYVDTVNSSRQTNGKRRGTIVIKVLPDRLDAFLARLHDLGEVKSQNVSTADVTKEYFDTEARLRNARRMEDRLLKLLDEAKGKLSEVLQVEKELGRVREDIEKMQGELQLYDSLVRFATVTIDLFEKDLQQPATFRLTRNAELFLLAGDVEKTYANARSVAADAQAQVLASDLARASDGRLTAHLSLLIAPDAADNLLDRIRGLARVQTFQVRDNREAQNGSGRDTDPGAKVKVERGPVTLNLTIAHDEETYRRVSLTVTAADPAAAFDKARAAGLAAAGEIVSSNFEHTQGVRGHGHLVLRLPPAQEAPLLEVIRALGRTSNLDIVRDDNAPPDAGAAPILLTLDFADQEAAVQQTDVAILCGDVSRRVQEVRQIATNAGAQIESSSFEQGTDGHEEAALTFRLPLRDDPAFIGHIRSLGEVKELHVSRQDRPELMSNGGSTVSGSDDTAPAEVSLRLYNQGRVIDDASGIGATFRRTLAQGIGALMWSLRMIGVAAAFLAPWLGAVVLIVLVVRLAARWRQRRS